MGISMEKIEDRIGEFFKVIFGLIFGGLFFVGIFGGLAVLIYQCYLWLQKGFWKSIHLIDVAKDYIPIDTLNWMQSPSSWVGVSKIFSYIVYDAPLSGVLIIGSISFLMVFVIIIEES